MSLGKRIWDIARSNITDFRDALKPDALDGLSEQERQVLDTEAADTVGAKAGRKARQFRDAAEEAWEKAYDAAQARNGGQPGARPTPEAERIRWYRTLELEPGADLATVRKSYRRLLKQYHPDKFAKDPEKYKAATEVTRNITAAYDGLTTLLGG
ncbi:MAG: DnaJ domain-containing protein [Myxococcales bacterium]|nr:DnaJ domain-containing protein [Myxococcales bacterium]